MTLILFFTGINVLMLALPALFKKDGNITIDFDSIKYPVDEVYLNKEKAITVLPVSLPFCFVSVFIFHCCGI